MLSIADIFNALQVAICCRAFLWLTEAGQIFALYGRFLHRLEWKSPVLYKPLGGCLQCFTGQVAFWLSAAIFGLSLKIIPFTLITIFIQIWLSKYSD
jgi:hypothetical protein